MEERSASAKQMLSGRLQGLKFMQRARKREEALQKQQKEEEEESGAAAVVDESHWVAPGHDKVAASRKCVVIVEGDPKPSASLGRMSFQNFNPAVDKIFEEVEMRRQKLRQGTSTANGEISREVSTESQQQREKESVAAAAAAVYANDEPLRKKLKTEKIVVVKTEAATTVMTPTPSVKQNAKIVADRHSQKLESKQGFQKRDQGRNQGRDWRQLRPPGREEAL